MATLRPNIIATISILVCSTCFSGDALSDAFQAAHSGPKEAEQRASSMPSARDSSWVAEPPFRCVEVGCPATPAGLRGKIVSTAVKVLAGMIRHGGKYVSKIVRYLDDDAARMFRKHSNRISAELNRIAKIPDLTTRIVKENLYNFLKNEIGLSGGTALEIADAVAAVLNWMIL